ncbi:DUF3224 domain-containing protein [Mitsuaria sp. WAJ17]|uniref:DUF3224 domain-containing protein n=1 Tax=Mitsuaria sp. WAJ17 TaxID=2761452 RepID=UPI0015FF7125|nr:DUF3224 domain-containing protein [Mitsuaria sp. WAJ17]MBB2487219.1 DUF3224 domain-containing protein [Mitsuaria sp. WAJ17]
MSQAPHAGTAAPQRCSGAFKVSIQAPQMMPSPDGGPPQARRSLEKQYEGGLQGRSLGEMLAAGHPQQGEAAYVALESFQGTLQGRAGGFALAHLGLMHAGRQDLRIALVPGSGTGALQGITGELTLRIEGGVHHYELVYTLPAAVDATPH